MMKVILLGYMGSGKSTVSKMLAEKRQLPHFDLDEMIEEKAGMPVKEIFSAKGEIHFRKLEHELFHQLMERNEDFVLSLGGGTPCYANNHLLFTGENTISIYLKASIAELYNRLTDEKQHRPLISNAHSEDMKEFIAKHLFERSYFYNQAMHAVNVDGKSAEDVVSEVEKLLI
ncbi:shikimate kinase [Flavobacterium noncentrifugens]|uniref:Shikimate kinase n=1 Tax=Flavobacterium noncentrifugens TaxID=1128970 RepID=A0A1G9CEL2_9FLAO|nr:shikimate kinase [Flavobacterium noncentrifugens]GEP52008.1 shikimate kinase [Flavobacterium noncentrifugens]SDK50091.1 shikimate kinase [Flavobacterium noncentrifugens]